MRLLWVFLFVLCSITAHAQRVENLYLSSPLPIDGPAPGFEQLYPISVGAGFGTGEDQSRFQIIPGFSLDMLFMHKDRVDREWESYRDYARRSLYISPQVELRWHIDQRFRYYLGARGAVGLNLASWGSFTRTSGYPQQLEDGSWVQDSKTEDVNQSHLFGNGVIGTVQIALGRKFLDGKFSVDLAYQLSTDVPIVKGDYGQQYSYPNYNFTMRLSYYFHEKDS